jgi:alcohol dehydrogenase
VKHSLSLSRLFPEAAVIDPGLMVGKPRDLTISTGLDALSHALESLWNKNANPVSMRFAVSAARDVLALLPRLVDDLGNLELRAGMAQASLYAGLAFSNTKTAIAHSLSYPITLRYGVTHGIACSFTLPMVLKSMARGGGLCGEGLRAIFGENLWQGAERLTGFLHELGIATDPAAYGISAEEWAYLVDAAFAGERGQNFIGTREGLLAAMALPHAAEPAPPQLAAER